MQTTPVTYHLTRSSGGTDTIKGFQRIIDYLLTFVGEVEVQKDGENLAHINYTGTNISSTLKTDSSPKRSDSAITGQITLVCDPKDDVSINLIKNVTQNIGFRIYNPQTNSFLVNDPNLLDLTIYKIDHNISNIFDRYLLTPLFQYNGSLVFFAKDKEGNVHLVNRHLLEYLRDNPKAIASKGEFSKIVASNIGVFVALADRGMIPISYHKFLDHHEKINNLNGLNIERLSKSVLVSIIYFRYDVSTQSFLQTEFSNLPNKIKVKNGRSLVKNIETELRKSKVKSYIAIKIAQDIGYEKKGKTLVPVLSVSVFLEN